MPYFLFLGVYFLAVFSQLVVIQFFRKRYKEKAAEPFTELPLRPPGESLRLKLVELNERILNGFVPLLLGIDGIVAILFALSKESEMAIPVAALLFIVSAWPVWRLKQLLQERSNYELGYYGERVVAEGLNQLLADGYKVFHDTPFDGFNIDHILVGPSGVFAVETKTRRKPRAAPSGTNHRVKYDGLKLTFPNGIDEAFIKQTSLNARTLSKWLTQACGEPVSVRGILTLPGWFVERSTMEPMAVLNPKEIRQFLLSQPSDIIRPDQKQRIVYQLTERCRFQKN